MKTKIAPLVAFLALSIVCGPNSGTGLRTLASFDFEDGKAEGWRPNRSSTWEVSEQGGSFVYALTSPGEAGEVAAPLSWSVLDGLDVEAFEFSGRLKCLAATDNPNRDLCIFFHYQDPIHFYYVHFSTSSDERHNIIGLVNGEDRIKINIEPVGESLFRLTDQEWHTFKVTYDKTSGNMAAYLDDMESPILTASGSMFGHGLVGIGSYDDTGCFDDIALKRKE